MRFIILCLLAVLSVAPLRAETAAKAEIVELKPNAGVRGLIATALVQFTLSDPDPVKRRGTGPIPHWRRRGRCRRLRRVTRRGRRWRRMGFMRFLLRATRR